MTPDFTNIEVEILRNLYLVWDESTSEGVDNINTICEVNRFDPKLFNKVVDRLEHEMLIQRRAFGGFYNITPVGTITSEQREIAPVDLVSTNTQARTLLLNELYTIYEEGDSLASGDYETLASSAELDTNIAMRNLMLLEKLGYVKWEGGGFCRITHHGIDAVLDWKKKETLVSKFEEISELRPQTRGRELQRLFAQLLDNQGWYQEEGARTSHEEMDVIFSKEREYYLAECKWEKTPIEAAVVRELYGKLGNRVDVRGLLMSMSGFSSGTTQQVEDYIGQKIILLFGPEDVRSMFYGTTSFDSLLNEKYKSLVVHRRVTFR